MKIATLGRREILSLAQKNIQWGRTFLGGAEMMTGRLPWTIAFGSGLAGEEGLLGLPFEEIWMWKERWWVLAFIWKGIDKLLNWSTSEVALFENALKSCFDEMGEEAVVSLNKLATFVTSFLVFHLKGESINFDSQH